MHARLPACIWCVVDMLWCLFCLLYCPVFGISYHCAKTTAGMKKLLLRIFCDGNGLDVLERKLEYKFWPWNDILLCRVTLEEHRRGKEGANFWVKLGVAQEVYEPCF